MGSRNFCITDETEKALRLRAEPVTLSIIFSKAACHFFLNNAALITPLGSFTRRMISQMISPSATTDKPR